MAKTWILTGSLANFRATREHGFRVIGAKEGRRRMAEPIDARLLERCIRESAAFASSIV